MYWELASISPIIDDHGSITHFLAVKEDITKRKSTDLSLKKSEMQFRTLFENAMEGIVFYSSLTEPVKLIRSYAEMHGYTVDEMHNMS